MREKLNTHVKNIVKEFISNHCNEIGISKDEFYTSRLQKLANKRTAIFAWLHLNSYLTERELSEFMRKVGSNSHYQLRLFEAELWNHKRGIESGVVNFYRDVCEALDNKRKYFEL